MANLNDVEKFKQYLINIQNILSSLSERESVSSELLNIQLKKYKELNTLYKGIIKYTHDGDFSTALRVKLKKLSSWRMNLDSLLHQEGKMKKHQTSALDLSEVEKYVDYIEKIEYFAENFKERLSVVKKKVFPLEKSFQFLSKNWKNFQLQETDLVSSDLLKIDDNNAVKETKFQVASPEKTLKMVKASVNEFARMIKRTNLHLFRINELSDDLSSPSLENILSSLNEKNVLVKKLLQQMSELNGLIYNGKFQNEALIRQKYEELLRAVSRHLPPFMVSKLILPEKSKIDQLNDSSVGGMKEQMRQDISGGVNNFVSPWIQQPKINPKPIESPIPTGQYERYIKENKIPLIDKSRYEKLWDE